MSECMETCQVGVPCPHGLDCEHLLAGRLRVGIGDTKTLRTNHRGTHMREDDLDILMREHGEVFPEDWDAEDIMLFCCRYVNSNIEDIKEFFDLS